VHGPNPMPYNADIVHDMLHFKTTDSAKSRGLTKTEAGDSRTWANPFQHSVWTQEEVDGVARTHRTPTGLADKAALSAVKLARWGFDTLSGYRPEKITKDVVMNRAIFLETVAGVPGMAGGMMRHLSSLRNMRRDHGWIHTLLEEAENERMHLLVFVTMKQPGPFFRAAVVGAQGIFMTAFVAAYCIYPPLCHRFVGYLEEEAVHTYSDIIKSIDNGRLEDWKTELAPQIAVDYWHLRPGATMRDLILVVRADESSHRDVNHTFADLGADEINPYVQQQQKEVRVVKRTILSEQKANKDFIRNILTDWDKDRKGSLAFEELRSWLSSISNNRPVTGCEVKWVMSMAAQDKMQDYTTLNLTPDLFAPAAEAFLSYNTSYDQIVKLMEEYDVDKTGNLNKQVCAQRVIFSSHFLLHRIVRLYILIPYIPVDGGVQYQQQV